MALAWQYWTHSPHPLPRDADLWDQAFASNQENYLALGRLTQRKRLMPDGSWVIPSSVDLKTVGNTTILRTRQGHDGHWHLNGGAISLPELFEKFGEEYTVAELMLWYHNAPKVCRRRNHAWGSPDKIKAARQRFLTYHHYGHRG